MQIANNNIPNQISNQKLRPVLCQGCEKKLSSKNDSQMTVYEIIMTVHHCEACQQATTGR